MVLDSLFLGFDHAKRLYPLGQKQARRRRLRFLLRCLWWSRSSRQWFLFIDRDPVLRSFSLLEPTIAAKPFWRYLRRSWRPADRLNCILDHYGLMLSSPQGRQALELARTEGAIARFQGRSDADYAIVLATCTENRREGELRIELRREGRRICCLCGSFCERDGRRCFIVGTMQGARGADARDIVREVTKDLYQLRPRDLVLTAAQAMSAIFGAKAILAPAIKQHIYAGKRRPGRVKADFNELWADLGGETMPCGDYALPLETQYKALEDIQPKRRSETLRRYALKQRIAETILSGFGCSHP